MSRITITLVLISLCFLACKESNYIIIKDPEGRVQEKYKVNQDSLKHGDYSSYINGTLIEQAQYSSGVLQGPRKMFHTNGAIEIEEHYDKGVIVGPYKTYYFDGTLAQEANYIKGMMQGTLKTYYKEGALKEEVTMVDNNENGPFKEYHASGQLKWEGQFLNGDNEFGLLQNYNEAGELIKKMMCDSLGVCATIWTKEDGDIQPQN